MLAAIACGVWGFIEGQKAAEAGKEANKQLKMANEAKYEAKEAGEKVAQAEGQVTVLNSQLQSKRQDLDSKQKELSNAVKKAANKLREAKQAREQADVANQKAEQAELAAQNAQKDLALANETKTNLQQQAQQLKRQAKDAQKLADAANNKLQEVQIAKTQAEEKLAQTQANYDKTLQAFTAVRGLSVLAGTLRKEGLVSASDQALRMAGLSTLIDDEELKQAWILAATAEGYLSLAHVIYLSPNKQEQQDKQEQQARKKGQEAIIKSINLLKNINVKGDIFQQVSAFAYLMDGQLNDNQQAYMKAYQASTLSKFNPFDVNPQTDILRYQDVKSIYQLLMDSKNIDSNSNDPVAIAFRQFDKSITTRFFCGLNSQGMPTTFVITPNSKFIPVIIWVSSYFGDRKLRCEEVSRRFDRTFDQGYLNYLDVGYIDNQPVICARKDGLDTLCSRLLFEIKASQDPHRVLQELNNSRAVGSPVYQ